MKQFAIHQVFKRYSDCNGSNEGTNCTPGKGGGQHGQNREFVRCWGLRWMKSGLFLGMT